MIIVVGNDKGGVGKSAIATNLAAIGVSKKLDVLLLDTDPQGSSTSWNRIRNEEGVEPSISVVSVPENPLHELKQFAGKYHLIIVDVGANSYKTMLNAVKVADLVLVPTGPDQLELESTLSTLETLRGIDNLHKDGKVPSYVVLNQLSTNSRSKEEAALREFLEEVQVPVLNSALRHRTAWRNSRRGGLAVHELTGRETDHKASAEMHALFAELESLVA